MNIVLQYHCKITTKKKEKFYSQFGRHHKYLSKCESLRNPFIFQTMPALGST